MLALHPAYLHEKFAVEHRGPTLLRTVSLLRSLLLQQFLVALDKSGGFLGKGKRKSLHLAGLDVVQHNNVADLVDAGRELLAPDHLGNDGDDSVLGQIEHVGKLLKANRGVE